MSVSSDRLNCFENGKEKQILDWVIEKVLLILSCYLDDAITCAVSADLKMVARNRPLT